MVIGMDHQPTRENSDPAFERAHVYVHREGSYILPVQQGLSEGDHSHVSGAQQFLHAIGVGQLDLIVEPETGAEYRVL